MLFMHCMQVKKAREAGTVDAATLSDSDPGLPFKVRAFMRLDRTNKFLVGSGAMLSSLPVWPQIYLCLRCGGRGDAGAIARAALASTENSRCSAHGRCCLVCFQVSVGSW